jgi:hypothetical protein
MAELSANQIKLISDAAQYLERPSLLMEIANLVGKPLEFFGRGVNKVTAGQVDATVNTALRTALVIAVSTVPAGSDDMGSLVEADISDVGSRTALWHKLSVAITGTAGGLFGLAGIAVELPITTTIMLRSIAAIAKEFGEDLQDPAIRLQCLTVFCLGGPGKGDDAMESAYLTSRLGLQSELTLAARATAGLTAEELAAMIQKGTAPAVVNLISRIAARFNVAVTEKMIAQAIPVLGAATWDLPWSHLHSFRSLQVRPALRSLVHARHGHLIVLILLGIQQTKGEPRGHHGTQFPPCLAIICSRHRRVHNRTKELATRNAGSVPRRRVERETGP